MGRIVSNFFMSMDGVVEAPHEWHFPYFDDAMGEIVGEGMAGSKAVLLGHRLYDEWAEYWPAQESGGENGDFPDIINGMPKYVVAHEPFEATWNNSTVLSGGEESIRDQVQSLKDGTDGDITMSGCATTVRWLIKQSLLDELALLVHPIAVAKGQRLFEDTGTVKLALTESRTLPTGVMFVRYATVHD